MSIFKTILSWFTPKHTEVTNAVETVTYDGPTDILGNEVHPGDYVVRVKYNDLARRGYFTIAENYDVIAYRETMRFKVVKVDALHNLTSTTGRKHGYLHVSL